MNMTTVAVFIAGFLVLVWFGWTAYVRLGIKEPTYVVLDRMSGFELRQYDPYLVAYTDVSGTSTDALTDGFRILAGYIFGGNVKKESIAMTAPVMQTDLQSETISMTAPVTEQIIGDMHRVTFVMPKNYTLESLPTPNDERVKFVEVPAKKYAVLRFGWYATESRITAKKRELLSLVESESLTTVSEPLYAGYNDPWSFPLLIRNEILIEVE